MAKQKSIAERFWSKVDIRKPDECWPWLASFGTVGYGQMNTDSARPVGAHRISWELSFGPIPSGLCVLHICDNKRCVNPAHLFLGTQTDNMKDMTTKGRRRTLRGEESGRARLTTKDVLAIRASNETNTALALKYGVKQNTVCSARNRTTWRHV